MQGKQLIKKEQWVNDQSCKFCHQCKKGFIIIIRRKHHCRWCGKVFCDNCSNYYVDHQFFQNDAKQERRIRLCQTCFQQLAQLIGNQGEVRFCQTGGQIKYRKVIDNFPSNTKSDQLKPDIFIQGDEQDNIGQIRKQYRNNNSRSLLQNASTPHRNENQYSCIQEQKETKGIFNNLFSQTFKNTKQRQKNTSLKTQPSESSLESNSDLREIQQNLETIHEQMHEVIANLVSYQIDSMKLQKKWTNKIYSIIISIIKDLQIDSLKENQNKLDIESQVKIKKIPSVSSDYSHYYKGVVYRIDQINQQNLNLKFDFPNIMIIICSLDLNFMDDQVNEKINDDEKLRMLAHSLIKQNPDIILVQGQVHQIILDELTSNNICILQNLKTHYIERIAKATGAICIRDYRHFYYYDISDKPFMGKCDKIYFKQFDPQLILKDQKIIESLTKDEINQLKQYIELKKEKQNNYTYMYLLKEGAENCITITLTGYRLDELRQLKKAIQILSVIAYNLNIEKQWILVDQQFKRNLIYDSLKDSNFYSKYSMVTCGNITEFISTKLTEKEMIQNQSFNVSILKLTYANLKDFHDVKDNFQGLYNYIQNTQNLYNKTKSVQLCEMCDLEQQNKAQYYGQGDMTLGQFIVERINQKNELCKCKKPKGQHIGIYYGLNAFARFKIQQTSSPVKALKLKEDFQQQKQPVQQNIDMSEVTIGVGFQPKNKLFKPTTFEQIEQSILFQQNECEVEQTEEPIQQNLEDYLRECKCPTKDRNVVVQTYLECDDCKQVITPKMNLKKIHLEYSFNRFLQRIFMTVNQEIQRKPDIKWLENELPAISQCRHKQVQRVFQYHDAEIRIYANLHLDYKINSFSIVKDSVQDELNKINTQMIESRRTEIIAKLDEIYAVLKPQIKGRINQLNPGIFLNAQAGAYNTAQNQLDEEFHKVKKDFLNYLLSKLQDKVKEYKKVFKEFKYRDFLIIENESMKTLTWFFEFQKYVKNLTLDWKTLDKEPNDNIPTQDQNGKIQPQQVKVPTIKVSQPGDQNNDSMLNFLINTKVIQKEILKDQIQKRSDQRHQQNIMKKAVDKNFTITSQTRDSDNQTNTDQDRISLNQQQQQQQQQLQPQKKQSKKITNIWPRISLNYNEIRLINPPLYSFIPLYSNDETSILAYAFNQPIYYQLYQKSGISTLEGQKFPNIFDEEQVSFIKSKLIDFERKSEQVLCIKINAENQPLQPQNIELNRSPDIQNILDAVSDHKKAEQKQQQNQQENEEVKHQRIQKIQYDVIIYYPEQFEVLRMINNISLQQWVKSLATCVNWDSTGGKSGSKFYKSDDKLFIIKQLKEHEFFMFEEFAPQYFEHLYKNVYKGQPSILTKTYGMFEIQSSKGNGFFIAMENIFNGISTKNIVYDLKGSELRRWVEKGSGTLQDTNFRIDRNAEPIPIHKDFYYDLRLSIIEDSEFLAQCRVIDYSLLLIIDKVKRELKVGIIDYMQQYSFSKKMETKYKQIINLGTDPTIIDPDNYKQRFQTFLDRCFMESNY